MSSLTWLAHTESERRRTLDVIRLFDEPQTLDELGIGGIRDGLSDQLFPGTSTIQTRARYFLFIPWIYRDLEERAPHKRPAQKARAYELRLIDALKTGSPGADGIIGTDAGQSLQRLPSEIYWLGLGSWGIRLGARHRSAYHGSLRSKTDDATVTDDDGEPLYGSKTTWHPELPQPPEKFLERTVLDCTPAEGEYLVDRIMTRHSASLLAWLVATGANPTSALELGSAPFPWDLGESVIDSLPEKLRILLLHAERFSLTIHGAFLLYNLLLAMASGNDELQDAYRADVRQWESTVEGRREELRRWAASPAAFAEIVRGGNPRVRPLALAFLEQWAQIALQRSPVSVADSQHARALVSDRERQIKGPKARLSNSTALAAWGGASGTRRLAFRWPQVTTLVTDITAPLSGANER